MMKAFKTWRIIAIDRPGDINIAGAVHGKGLDVVRKIGGSTIAGAPERASNGIVLCHYKFRPAVSCRYSAGDIDVTNGIESQGHAAIGIPELLAIGIVFHGGRTGDIDTPRVIYGQGVSLAVSEVVCGV